MSVKNTEIYCKSRIFKLAISLLSFLIYECCFFLLFHFLFSHHTRIFSAFLFFRFIFLLAWKGYFYLLTNSISSHFFAFIFCFIWYWIFLHFYYYFFTITTTTTTFYLTASSSNLPFTLFVCLFLPHNSMPFYVV